MVNELYEGNCFLLSWEVEGKRFFFFLRSFLLGYKIKFVFWFLFIYLFGIFIYDLNYINILVFWGGFMEGRSGGGRCK